MTIDDKHRKQLPDPSADERPTASEQSSQSAVHDVKGWIVMGFVGDEPTAATIKSVPVLSKSLESAIIAAASAHAGFKPVGALSEDQLQEHLAQIHAHRQEAFARE